jgi:TM2 domain-containing membrane protein YozV
MANPITSFFFTLSPLILIILGVAVYFAGKLAKFVGIVIAILGLVELLFPYLMKVV